MDLDLPATVNLIQATRLGFLVLALPTQLLTLWGVIQDYRRPVAKAEQRFRQVGLVSTMTYLVLVLIALNDATVIAISPKPLAPSPVYLESNLRSLLLAATLFGYSAYRVYVRLVFLRFSSTPPA